MNDFVLAIILLVFATGGVVVRKTYYYLPAHELKRRAEKSDPLASKLYPAVAYGSSLRGLLWAFIGLTSAGGFVLLARDAPAWMSFVAVVLLLWVLNSWIPAGRVTKIGMHVTAIVTPFIVWLLNYVHPISSRGTELIEKRYTADAHTGIFERDDLLELIEQQQRQSDNRLSEEELEIARRALKFSDYKVSDVLTPRKKVKTTLANDTIGPVLIDELHKSGQGYMLVRDSAKGEFTGTLAFKRLSLDSTGKVRDIMDKEIYYVHENDPLSQALHAFFTTNHPLFVVVNSSEEYVGIVTIDNILRQLLGHIPGDDFDKYADITAVANRHVKPKKSKEPEPGPEELPETPVKTDGEVVE